MSKQKEVSKEVPTKVVIDVDKIQNEFWARVQRLVTPHIDTLAVSEGADFISRLKKMADTSSMMSVPVNMLHDDEMVKVRPLNESHVKSLAEKWDIARCSPLMVLETDSGYSVICGNHRAAAARSINVSRLPCVVIKESDPLLYRVAVIDNSGGSLLMSKEEIRGVILSLFASGLSIRQTQSVVNMSVGFIHKVIAAHKKKAEKEKAEANMTEKEKAEVKAKEEEDKKNKELEKRLAKLAREAIKQVVLSDEETIKNFESVLKSFKSAVSKEKANSEESLEDEAERLIKEAMEM